jgi:hypothetical protein
MCAITALAVIVPLSDLMATDWYVSAARGKGKKGTMDKPAVDLSNIINKLEAGDTVHIAEGTYTGKGDCGYYEILVPVSIIGGYSDDFSKRDPWGAHKTIFAGTVNTPNYKPKARLEIDLMKYANTNPDGAVTPILIDGIIVNHGFQNRYKTEKKQMIERLASPKKKENPTPDQGAIRVSVSKCPMRAPAGSHWDITVRNCVVVNSAPTQGVINVAGYKGSKVVIENNLTVNNTGVGIYAMGQYHGKDDFPVYEINNNTVLFTWKYDAVASSFSGSSLKIDDDVLVTAKNNVFGFSDRVGILKKGAEPLLMVDNLIVGNVGCDYYEETEDMRMSVASIEDEAENLHDDSEGFSEDPIKPDVGEKYMALFGSRVLVDRNAAEADIKAESSNANALRGMLGLPLQAGTVAGVEGDVWLPFLELEDAVKAGLTKYHGKYGCAKPKAVAVTPPVKKP